MSMCQSANDDNNHDENASSPPPPDSSLSSSHCVHPPPASASLSAAADNPDDEQEQHPPDKTNNSNNNKTKLGTACTYFKYTYSTLLLLFSLVVVLALIWNEDTTMSQDAHRSVAYIVLILAIAWLSVVEGGQGAVVGLVPIAPNLYQETHPWTYRITSTAHKGDTLDRYLIGRQFLTVLLVFVVNQCGAPVDDSVSLWNMANVWQEVWVRSSLAIILVTVMVGQLHGQINASHCMLDYSNTRSLWWTLQISRLLEASGAMHAVYLLQQGFATWSGKPVESKEPRPRSTTQQVLFVTRVLLSLALLAVSLAVTLAALFQEQTDMWAGVPPWASVVLFVGLLVVLGMLEGTQIAVFAVSQLPMDQQEQAPAAMRVLQVLFQDEGRNIPRFMIGRQVCVTLTTFLLARITNISVNVHDDDSENVFGVSDGLQEFFNTGLLGAVVVTILGSISWKLIGSAFPVFFLSNPMVYLLLRLSLALEASGICAGAWVLAWTHRRVAKFQTDDCHVGTPEDRARNAHPDSTPDSESVVHFRETTSQVGSSRYLLVDNDTYSRASRRSSRASVPFGSDAGAAAAARSSSKLLGHASALDEEHPYDRRNGGGVPKELNLLAKVSSRRNEHGEITFEVEMEQLEDPSEMETDDDPAGADDMITEATSGGSPIIMDEPVVNHGNNSNNRNNNKSKQNRRRNGG